MCSRRWGADGEAEKPKKPRRDETREERISMEIVVDAYDEDERAMGWITTWRTSSTSRS